MQYFNTATAVQEVEAVDGSAGKEKKSRKEEIPASLPSACRGKTMDLLSLLERDTRLIGPV